MNNSIATLAENSQEWILILNKDIFPIVDYSKDANGNFTGHLIQTSNDVLIYPGQTLFTTMYTAYSTRLFATIVDQMHSMFISSNYSKKNIEFLAMTEENEIIIKIKK